nr:hypothetical protein [Tanacetum cinerariifolium]
MILKSVEQGPLLWLTVEEDGVTRLKKYSELSAAEAIQADCDVKAKKYHSARTSSGGLCFGQYSQGSQGIMGTDSDANARHVVD